MKIGKRAKATKLGSHSRALRISDIVIPRLEQRLKMEKIMETPQIHSTLKALHKNFVITTIDKASGNFAVTCKKLYLQFLEKELNTVTGGNRTYEPLNTADCQAIVDIHDRSTRGYGLETLPDGCIPKIHAIPKMHKNPVKARFITGAQNSSLKPISLELQKILQFLKEHFRRYCTQITERTGVTHYFSISNTEQVVQKLRSAHGVSNKLFCADFASLFTNLPHDVVIDNLYGLIDMMFKNSNMEYVVTSGSHVRYSKQDTGKIHCYHKNDVKFILKTILDNSFAMYAGTVYKQNRGIPQGNNASPQIADLTLSFMEFRFVKEKVNRNHALAFSLSRTFRYIDDLLHCSSNAADFVNITSAMYHSSLTLEQTNNTDKKSAFLDLDIECTRDGVTTSLYNKTDDYSFSVVRYPHFSSCIPRRIGLNTLHGEFLRIYRNCSKSQHFYIRSRALTDYFFSVGYPRTLINSRIIRTIKMNPSIALKYGISDGALCASIL